MPAVDEVLTSLGVQYLQPNLTFKHLVVAIASSKNHLCGCSGWSEVVLRRRGPKDLNGPLDMKQGPMCSLGDFLLYSSDFFCLVLFGFGPHAGFSGGILSI
jgi:hypothetical protein